MILAYAAKLGFITRKIRIGTQKIDGLPLKTYGMTTAKFFIQNSLEKIRFFEKTFLLADIGMEVILEMLFLFLSNADVKFGAEKLTSRSYMAVEAVLSTS